MSRTHIAKEPKMGPEISFRPARPDDYEFTAGLYLDSMRRLLTALGTWDEERVVARFRQEFAPERAQVICSDGVDIGWMQVSEAADGFRLDQIHLVDRFRGRGIGTRLIEGLLAGARGMGTAVALNVIRGNPAISLYHRLGFRVVGEDKELLRMRWEPARPRRS